MFVKIDGARIFFDVVGAHLKLQGSTLKSSQTLVILHGGPGYDHMTLRPYFDRFADTFQVIYLDHRGCGRSEATQDTWTLDQWADDIARFCEVLGIEKPLVYGQSFGGMVAMHYAARHPTAPEKLILSSTAARFLLDETVAKVTELGGAAAGEVARNFFSKPSLAGYDQYSDICLPLYNRPNQTQSAAFRDWAIQKPEVNVHFFSNEMKEMDLRSGISAITCPTLVLGGVEDPVTPPRCSEEIAQAIGENARLELFENCGHGVHRDEPQIAEMLMRSFLCNS